MSVTITKLEGSTSIKRTTVLDHQTKHTVRTTIIYKSGEDLAPDLWRIKAMVGCALWELTKDESRKGFLSL